MTMASSAEPVAQGTAYTVLVVEDELTVRLPIAEYLRDCGYSVLEAGNAGEAIDVIDNAGSVSVVFSDVRMPGAMDGFGLAKWCQTHHPEIPVLLTSGYNPNRVKTGNDGAVQLITKPYTQAQIAHRIAAVLSR